MEEAVLVEPFVVELASVESVSLWEKKMELGKAKE